MLKKLFIFLSVITIINSTKCIFVKAQSQDEIYRSQLEKSGADKLQDDLPTTTKKDLNLLGINGIDWKEICNLTPEKVMTRIFSIVKESLPLPLKASLCVIAIILLSALVDSFKLSITQGPLNGTMNVISTLCICIMAIDPIISFIGKSSNIIKCASRFMLCYIPVMSGIMVASGQTISATSYNLTMITALETISQIASELLTPLLSILLALSIISSISPTIKLNGICNAFGSFIKWGLGLSMTVFVGLITLQSAIGNSADSASLKTTKFIISNFVPIVGNAIGDAFSTVQSCIKLLKSGVGAFGILAASFIFLPVLIECIIWIISLNICSAIGEMFNMNKISCLLSNSEKVISTTLSILLSCMMLLIVSTVIVLIIGGNSA